MYVIVFVPDIQNKVATFDHHGDPEQAYFTGRKQLRNLDDQKNGP